MATNTSLQASEAWPLQHDCLQWLHPPGKLVGGQGGVSKQKSWDWPVQQLKAASCNHCCTLHEAVT